MGRAGIGVRLTAGLIDALAIIILYWIFDLIFFPSFETATEAKVRLSLFFGSLLMVAYSLTDVFFRATPGKLLFKLRVTNAAGYPATQGQLWMRWLFRWGFLFLHAIFGLSLLMVFRYTTFMGATAVFTLFMMMLSSIGWAIYDRWAGTSITQLGYLQLPQGLGRIIYWNPAMDAPSTGGGFPVAQASAPQPASPISPPPPMPPAHASTAPISIEEPATVSIPPASAPAGPGAPVGDIPTRVAARRPADEGAIPLEEPGSPPPPPPQNPV